MYRLFFLLYFIFIYSFSFSQNKVPYPEFEPGQLIIKLKDDVKADIVYGNKPGSGVDKNSINEDIAKLLGIDQEIKNQELLFSYESVQRSMKVREENIRRYNDLNNIPATQQAPGSKSSDDNDMFFSMKNVIKLEFEDPIANIHQIIDQLKDNPKVDYVEPNYIFSINDYTIESDIIYDNDLKPSTTTTLTTPSDPLYDQQSGITKTNIDDVWTDYGTGDGSQIVAVLDTGVDYTHPDLEANIWINTAEQNGVEGVDDDGNGYIDDIRGWDFINDDNAPLDDNMHGTHVAGIIGAVGNNDKGIAGAAWNVKIMPIKVFQSSGRGNTTDIALGVDYARVAGATIQNYSFGGFGESLTAKTAYENAYANNAALLVAAAGNSGLCIGPGLCPDFRIGLPFYPAAYTFILGVEDGENTYDNFDQDGPIYTNYPLNYLNYELKSIGTGVMSTVPDGGYRALTGTSMAAPLVAGAMALYLEQKPDDSKEIIFGNLINTAGSLVDFDAALDVTPTPLLKVLSSEIKDEIDSQNNNGFWEPGETLEIFPTIKNYWGPTDDVRVGIEFWEFEDTSKAELVETEIDIGSLSAYANLKVTDKSLKIKISENIGHDVDIQFKISVWSGPNKDFISSKKIILNSTNAIIIDEYINQDMTFLANQEYIIQNSLVIASGATLTIEEGVTIKMSADSRIVVDQNSKIFSNGTKNNPVLITSEYYWKGIKVQYVQPGTTPSGYKNGKYMNSTLTDDDLYTIDEWKSIDFFNRAIFKYTHLTKVNEFEGDDTFQGPIVFENSLLKNFVLSKFGRMAIWYKCNLDEGIVSQPYQLAFRTYWSYRFYETNFTNLDFRWGNIVTYSQGDIFSIHAPAVQNLWYQNSDWTNKWQYYGGYSNVNFINNLNSRSYSDPNKIGQSSIDAEIAYFPNKIYFGSGIESVLSKKFFSFRNSDYWIGQIDYSTRRTAPYEGAHAIVWKVLVNGKDAQDEYDEIDPIGVGEHEFKVYFNREMDTSVDPRIGYGVRPPYNQNIIFEGGSWSDDGKIFTVNHDINIGAADGINRIRVQDAKDLDNFYIPVEDTRFNILIQSAGSASTGFAATPGLGEVTLDWTSPSDSDLADLLGYNMYRFELNEDETYSDTLKINKNLITDINYKDFDVVRDKKYYYAYKILRTNFTETDYSTTVTTQLLTADLGDSNGDSSVNVLDVVNTVDYILGNSPKPFIDYATDVNNDSNINVLDVVGIVDLVLTTRPNGGGNGFKTSSNGVDYYRSDAVGKATFYWSGNDLYVESDYDIGAMQLVFDKDFKYMVSDNLNKFEKLNFEQDGKKVFMFYSFNGSSAGKKLKLLTRLDKAENPIDIDKAVVSTPKALKLTPVFGDDELPDVDAPEQGDEFKLVSISPNPSNGKIQVNYYLPEQMDKVIIRLYNQIGQLMWSSEDFNNNSGYSNEEVNVVGVPQGAYIVTMDAIQSGQIKGYQFKRLIINN